MFEDADELADHLAMDFLNSANLAAEFKCPINMALSGGSTPALFFQKLAFVPHRKNISWQHVHFFWVDERCVPPDDPDSNYGMTQKHLFDHISFPNENIHRIFGENDPEVEAKRYAKEIIQFVPQNFRNLPQFDWILLGLGSDGHTASIFPGSDVLEDRKNICAVATHPNTGQKRITLTLPVINHAKRVSFLVTGENKASVVAKILTGESKSSPAAFVRPVNGIVEWYLDQASGTVIIR